VAEVMSNVPLNIRFSRTLTEEKWNSWVSLLQRLININLSDEPDSFK
jgi:hypothetical protein